MKIYTSYFAKESFLRRKGLLPIGIALWKPRFYNGEEYKTLAPDQRTLVRKKNGTIDERQYTEEFKEKLANLDAEKVFQDLKRISQGKDIVLCCYERPEAFCHRHIVAEWLNEQLGITVEEIQF